MVALSVLIATIPLRKKSFYNLLNKLDSQTPINGTLEILWDDSVEYNIGVKRNKLLLRANGDYIVFIDDDDDVSIDYISKILVAIKDGSDCIGISGIMTTNGVKKRQWHISKQYGTWHQKQKIYYRTPNHISPVKREIALKVMFPEIAFGEDFKYSMDLLPYLKTETIVKGNIYHYKFISNK